MEKKGDDVDILFLPVVPNTIRVQPEQVEATSTDISTPNPIDKPTFDLRPNTKAADFYFEAEIQHLPFKLNLGDEMNMTCLQQGWFIDLIYDHPEVFSLHDEDLGFVTRSCIQYQWLWIDLYNCHTAPFPHNYKVKCVNVWTPGCNKALLGHHKVLTHSR